MPKFKNQSGAGGVSSRRPSISQFRFRAPAILLRFVSWPMRKRALSPGLSNAPGTAFVVIACARERSIVCSRAEACGTAMAGVRNGGQKKPCADRSDGGALFRPRSPMQHLCPACLLYIPAECSLSGWQRYSVGHAWLQHDRRFRDRLIREYRLHELRKRQDTMFCRHLGMWWNFRFSIENESMPCAVSIEKLPSDVFLK